MSQTGEYLSS